MILTFVLVIGFIASPIFSLTSVRVFGTNSISSDTITAEVNTFLDQKRFLIFRNRNKLFFRKEALIDHLNSAHAFESITIDRTGKDVAITVKERLSQLVWVTQNDAYTADVQGIILSALTKNDLQTILSEKKLIIFEDVQGSSVSIGNSIAEPEEISSILLFKMQVEALPLLIDRVKIDRLAGQWVALRTQIGFDILFDPSGDLQTQLMNLTTVLTDEIPDPSRLSYIDLRFGDHIYYK